MSRAPLRGKAAPAVPPRPRTKPPEVRREELMDAAARIFVAKGVAATSVDEIVAAADVAKGTFYIHFESKDHLLIALQQRFVATFCRDLQVAMSRRRAGDSKGRLLAWVQAGVDGYLDHRALHDVVFHQFRPHDSGAKHENPMVVQLADLLGQGTRAGAWSVEAPALTALMLFHALHGALDEAIGTATPVSRKGLAHALQAFFRRAVGLV